MERLAAILMLAMSGVMAGEESAAAGPAVSSAAQTQVNKAAESSVGWRTMVVTVA